VAIGSGCQTRLVVHLWGSMLHVGVSISIDPQGSYSAEAAYEYYVMPSRVWLQVMSTSSFHTSGTISRAKRIL